MNNAPITVAAMYHFAPLTDLERTRADLLAVLEDHEVRGTILVAEEGINGTVAGSREGVEAILAHIRTIPGFDSMEHKLSFCEQTPFRRTKVKLKKEIVTLGVAGVDPRQKVGTYVPPEAWNDLIGQEDVVLIDTRNRYETEVGTFEGALDPGTTSFREFPDFVQSKLDPEQHARVAMFCTGGIRCEKATSYLLDQGFKEVYHLRGGILKYLEEIPPEQSTWNGDCFVFDDRVTVTHSLSPGEYVMCHACRMPLSVEDREDPRFIEGECCLHCCKERTDADRERYHERERQMMMAAERGEAHLGPESPSARMQRRESD